MPIYGYRCGECGHELEVLQSMSDAPLRECPQCGGALRKLLYPVGVQFKGSGFYSTDYRSGRGSSSKGESGESGDSGATSSESASSESASSDGSSGKKAETTAAKETS